MPEPIRLAKRLAEMLPCSRREAELYIEGGWVSVDGEVIETPQFRVLDQKIELHADATLLPVEPVTILFHQPASVAGEPVLSMLNRWPADPSAIHPLRRHFAKLTPTLPLEPGASGLLAFTQNWRVARKLVDDAASVEQEYIVEAGGPLSAAALARLNHGLNFNGRALAPAKVSWQNETHLRFAIKGLKAGQITHMCKSVELPVVSIKRIRLGKLSMAKLPPGQWRYLGEGERF